MYDFMQVIDIYIDKVKKELYKLAPADAFLKELEDNLIDYSRDNPNCSMDDLIEQFGRPEELAKEFLENTVDYSPKIIARKNKKKKVIIALLCIALVAVVAYCIIISMQTQSKGSDVIIIYDIYDESAPENGDLGGK